MREDESFISCWSDPGFLSVDSGFSFTARSVLLPFTLAAWHPCETFYYSSCFIFFSAQAITASFPLLSSQSALDSDFTFIQSVPLIGSLIFYCLHKDLWHQQGSAEDRPFFPSFHSVIHSFVLKGQVVWTLAVYETQCCDFTCLTKGLFIQFLTSI